MTETSQDLLQLLFWILIFPGFLFTVCLGLIVSWIVRKVSALVHWRVGPPFLQPFYDVIKLTGKETLIPQEAQRAVFLGAPLVGLAGVLLLSVVLWLTTISQTAFVGDIIVAIYLMTLPSLALIFGSSASASPHAAVGTGREMKLIMSYELPLVLAFIVVIIKTGGQLSLTAITQQTPVLSISGMLAFLVSLLCIQAKLGFVPFDIAEAETELGSGVLMEYSGALLAIWKIVQAAMLVMLPLFLVMVFLGGLDANFLSGLAKPVGNLPIGIIVLLVFVVTGLLARFSKYIDILFLLSLIAACILAGLGKYVLIVVLIILIKNTNPRVRIDQAMKFFWFYCGITLVAAIILALIGNAYGINWL
ncbi:MAG: NADH-quinone oxidoreductase subunit H [Sedimentisphaerales bacterium]|nr:NADH-quinone oxidoreductase subunit H [Sedimentisphaerales bacterium]